MYKYLRRKIPEFKKINKMVKFIESGAVFVVLR